MDPFQAARNIEDVEDDRDEAPEHIEDTAKVCMLRCLSEMLGMQVDEKWLRTDTVMSLAMKGRREGDTALVAACGIWMTDNA